MNIRSDNPIRKPDDDVLGRSKLAQSFAEQVLSLDASEGIVVGVLGPWGSGKTSFLNLTRIHLENASVAVLDFNPWMFSGTEQVVESFFVELSAQLKLRHGLSEIGKNIEEYSEAFSGLGWLPLVGPGIERGRIVTKIIAKLFLRPKEGIVRRRAKVEKALAAIEKPVVVVVDDIDRLTSAEIRDIFKLVRLTANFPNLIYVLAFDRVRVETALTEQGISGRDYIEKIVQVAIDIPAVPAQVLSREILRAIEKALSPVDNTSSYDENSWPDVFIEVVRPLVRNMRDVRRYAAAIHGAVRNLNAQVALTDVLGLEAIRIFLPDVFGRLHRALDALVTPSDPDPYGGAGRSQKLKEHIEELIAAAGANGDVVRALVGRLFPAAQRHIGGTHYGSDWKGRWLRERRVAHEDVIRLYLEQVVGEGLQAFTDAEQAWRRMADRTAFDKHLRSLDPDRLRDVIASLETYEEEFGGGQVVPGTIVLLNLLPDLPERASGMLEFGAGFIVGRVVYRLVRSLKDPAMIEAVEEILPQVSKLSSRLELIETVGYREGVGHKLVSEAAANKFERDWRVRVRAAAAEELLAEKDLLWILLHAKRGADPAEPSITVADSPEMTLALLKSARTEMRSQPVGSRAVHRSTRLEWKALIELFGAEDALRERVEKVKNASLQEADSELLRLADKYVGGWRPTDFGTA